jgi:hypothetical protein
VDGSSKLEFNPTSPSPLDGNIKSKLGVIEIKGQIAVATKYDDAKVPEYLWDMRALGLKRPLKDLENKSLHMLRGVMLTWWKRQVVKIPGRASYRAWWALVDRTGDHEKDHTIGKDCILRVVGSTWWFRGGASTPLFWLWPDEFRKSIRDGTFLWLDMDVVPEYRQLQMIITNFIYFNCACAKLIQTQNGLNRSGSTIPGT